VRLDIDNIVEEIFLTQKTTIINDNVN